MRDMSTVAFIVVLTAAMLSAIPVSGDATIGCSDCDITNPSLYIIDPCFSLDTSSPCFPPEPNCLSAPLCTRSFPRGFVFGAASSAYQYEGAHNIDGRGQSIWDTFTYEHPDKIIDHTTGEIAVDHYNRYKEDIARMKEIGLDAYRFSISWSRVLPNGKRSGVVNQKGLTFYNNVINEIIAQRMQPFVTIFHWDLPQHLEFEYGGFLSKRIVQDFQDYAELLFETFGDRVKNWITFNEPSTYSTLGYTWGSNAPGRCSNRSTCPYGDSGTEPYNVTHNQLLAHAAAVDLYRKKFQDTQGGLIGITVASLWVVPYNYNHKDIRAQERSLDFQIGRFMGPITYGYYPKSMRDIVKERLPRFTLEEQKKLKGSIDFLGLNYYTSYYARDSSDNSVGPNYATDSQVQILPGNDKGFLGDMLPDSWIAIYPRGLMRLLVYIKQNYEDPVIYITENGLSDSSDPSLPLEEALGDTRRIKYHKCHLHSLLEAINARGVKVHGYFIWSFMDNLEWASGYTTRFGIVYVDHKNNLKRYNKASATWFSYFLNNRFCPLRMPEPMNVKEL